MSSGESQFVSHISNVRQSIWLIAESIHSYCDRELKILIAIVSGDKREMPEFGCHDTSREMHRSICRRNIPNSNDFRTL